MPQWAAQDGFDVRFDWGPAGVERLAPHARTVVIVDVLRFTSAVESACAAGVEVYPYRWKDDSAEAFAASKGAVLAGRGVPDGQRRSPPSLSPPSLARLPAGTSVVLPSPNGATCSILAAEAGAAVVAGCLRNAAAVARWLRSRLDPVAIIACGEAWPEGGIRPSLEDMLGAGAVIAGLGGSPSPEAQAAAAAFVRARPGLEAALLDCASGRELVEYGRRQDVLWCAALDASGAVPVLMDGAFRLSHESRARQDRVGRR